MLLPVTALLLGACGAGPDYPADWPRLQAPQGAKGSANCPDLSGSYSLPKMVKARVLKGKEKVLTPNRFLTALAGQAPSGRMSSSIHLASMTLEGPSEEGLKVTFRDRKGAVLSEHVLRPGVDFLCRGSWISDAKAEHTRAAPPRFYGKDVEGRLVGHSAYSAAGMVMILEVIPVPVYVNDRSWWRFDPVDAEAP